MVEAAFSSPRSNAFPAGLRVLIVDDDPTWLKILEKMLKKCSYEVTTCCLARDALNKLREKKDGFDIVISDVNMPDMDGFKLLEHVGLEMDLPVIMMSVDGEMSRVMKGVQHGACDYLLKPIRMKELHNIWQHVVRKRKHDLRDIESLEGIKSIHMTRSGLDLFDDEYLFLGEDTTSVRKRKDAESKHDDKDFSDPSSKKARVFWSVDLHQKFVKAVDQIGFDKVGPKKILDFMNIPWLTRENVASHLQKYRLYLSRLQRGNDVKDSFFGAKYTESSPKDNAGSFGLKHSANTRQSDVSGGFSLSTSSVHDPHNAKSSDTCFDHSLASADSCISYTSFDYTIPTQYSWTETTDVRFKQENESLDFKNCFDQLPLPEYLQPPAPICSGPSINESDVSNIIEAKMLTSQAFEPISTTTSSMKVQENMNSGFGSHFVPADEDLRFFWLHQGDFMEYDDPTLFAEVPPHLYETLRFDNEHLFDTTECSVIDLGLFIA